MAKAKSAEEAKVEGMKDMQARGAPDKKAYSIGSDLPEGMPTPHDKEDAPSKMGGVRKSGGMGSADTHMGHSGMGHAVGHLERDTERGAHVATVAGEKMYGHSGRMG